MFALALAVALQADETAAAIKDLAGKDLKLRAAAEKKLLALGEPALEPLARAREKSRDKDFRKRAGAVVVELAAGSYFPPAHRAAAAEALRKARTNRIMRLLYTKSLINTAGSSGWRFWELLLEDPDPMIRVEAVRALLPEDPEAPVSFRRPEYLPHVIEGLTIVGDVNTIVADALDAARSFSRAAWMLAGPSDLPALEPLLTHKQAKIRLVMAEALPHYRGTADAIWKRMLEDKDNDVRLTARGIVTDLRFEKLPAAMADMLTSSNPRQRLAAASQLARHGEERGMEALAAVLRGDQGAEARSILTSLGPPADAFFARCGEKIRPHADLPLLFRMRDEASRAAALQRVLQQKPAGPLESFVADWIVADERSVSMILALPPEQLPEVPLSCCVAKRDLVRKAALERVAWPTLDLQARRYGLHPETSARVMEILAQPAHRDFAAAAALAPGEAVELLRKACADPGAPSFEPAAFALARVGTPEDRLELLPKAARVLTASRLERWAATAAAATPPIPPAGPRAGIQREPKLGPIYAILLARTAESVDAPALRPLLRSESPAVAIAALSGLARLGDTGAYPTALGLFKEGKFPGRVEEVAALDPARSEAWLLPMLKDPDPMERAAAATVLARRKSAAALPEIRALARTEPWVYDREGNTLLDAYVSVAGEEASGLLEELWERGVLPPGGERQIVRLNVASVIPKIMAGRLEENVVLLEALVRRDFYARHAAGLPWAGSTVGELGGAVKSAYGVTLSLDPGALLKIPSPGRYEGLEDLLRATGAPFRSEADAVRIMTPGAAAEAWTKWWKERAEK